MHCFKLAEDVAESKSESLKFRRNLNWQTDLGKHPVNHIAIASGDHRAFNFQGLSHGAIFD